VLGTVALLEQLLEVLERRERAIVVDAGDREELLRMVATRPRERVLERGQDLVALLPLVREVGNLLFRSERDQRRRAVGQRSRVVARGLAGDRGEGEEQDAGERSLHAARAYSPLVRAPARSGAAIGTRVGRRTNALGPAPDSAQSRFFQRTSSWSD